MTVPAAVAHTSKLKPNPNLEVLDRSNGSRASQKFRYEVPISNQLLYYSLLITLVLLTCCSILQLSPANVTTWPDINTLNALPMNGIVFCTCLLVLTSLSLLPAIKFEFARSFVRIDSQISLSPDFLFALIILPSILSLYSNWNHAWSRLNLYSIIFLNAEDEFQVFSWVSIILSYYFIFSLCSLSNRYSFLRFSFTTQFSFLLVSACFASLFFPLLAIIIPFAICVYKLLNYLFLRFFTFSFSLSELHIILSILTLLISHFLVNLLFPDPNISKLDMCARVILIASVLLPCCWLSLIDAFRRGSTFSRISLHVAIEWLFLLMLGLVMYSSLFVVLNTEPLSFLLQILFQPVNLVITAYWIFVFASFTLILQKWSQFMNQQQIIRRKSFHFLAVVLFIPALLGSTSFLYICFAVALFLFMTVEVIRMRNLPPLGTIISEFFSSFIDDRDSGKLVVTHIYLLVGCAFPILFQGSTWKFIKNSEFLEFEDYPRQVAPSIVSRDLLPYFCGILIVGIGDSAATLFGKMFGKWHWKNSKKTLEGTIGAISLVLISWNIILFLVEFLGLIEVVSISWASIILSTICVCFVEAWTDQIDNLYLPLFYYFSLRLFSLLS